MESSTIYIPETFTSSVSETFDSNDSHSSIALIAEVAEVADATAIAPAPTDTLTPALQPAPPPTASPQAPQAHFTNKHTLQLIQGFLSAEKPKGIGPPEIAYVVYLMTCKAMDHPIDYSHVTLAEMLGCSIDTIERIEKTLKQKGYISQDSRRGRSKLTTVNLDRLPMADATLPTKPTEQAKELFQAYLTACYKYFPAQTKKKLRKSWGTSQPWNAQKILNRCGGDSELTRRMLRHAFNNPQHKRAMASKDLYKVWGRWKLIEKSYALELEHEPQAQLHAEIQAHTDATIDRLLECDEEQS